jgi:hypothetical protein
LAVRQVQFCIGRLLPRGIKQTNNTTQLRKFYLISIAKPVWLTRSGRLSIETRAIRAIQVDKEHISGLDQNAGMPPRDPEISGTEPGQINGHVVGWIISLAAADNQLRFNRHYQAATINTKLVTFRDKCISTRSRPVKPYFVHASPRCLVH